MRITRWLAALAMVLIVLGGSGTGALANTLTGSNGSAGSPSWFVYETISPYVLYPGQTMWVSGQSLGTLAGQGFSSNGGTPNTGPTQFWVSAWLPPVAQYTFYSWSGPLSSTYNNASTNANGEWQYVHNSDFNSGWSFYWRFTATVGQVPGSYMETSDVPSANDYTTIEIPYTIKPWPLSAAASPNPVYEGQTLTISADTGSESPLSVEASTPGGGVALAATGGGNWSASVPASWAPGIYTITVTATYSGGSQSTATVSVTVTQPPTVTGSLLPNPVKLGDTVAVTATTSGATFTSVTATDPDGTVTLTNHGGGKWSGQFLEDWATSGTYPITLTAYIQGGGQVASTVNLTINGTDVYVIPTNVW